MRALLPLAVFLLMLSVGLNLRPGQVKANSRRLKLLLWLAVLVATFVVPAAFALLLARLLHLDLGETVGLFMVGVAPGAPLLSRNMARRGFDLHLAATYQVSAALLVPIMLPLLVMAAGKFYGRDIWIPPFVLLQQIVLKQFVPLAIGILIAKLAPAFSARMEPKVNALGNVLFLLLLAIVLYMMGPALMTITLFVPLAVLLLAGGAMAAMYAVPFLDDDVRRTFAICNANRHAGLALLLSGQYLHARNATPTIACYALLAPLLMFLYTKQHRKVKTQSAIAGN